MSILINLLPDVRQAKLKEHRRRQLVSGVSVVVWVICGSVVALLSVYAVGQTAVIAGHDRNIKQSKAQLEGVSGLLDALTAEQHLTSLPTLYAKRVYMTKFFQSYTESNPTDIGLTSMTIDEQNAMIVNGTGTSYASVAKLARALQAAHLTVGKDAASTNTAYFTNVVITNVGSSAHGVSFTLSANLDSGVTSGSN